ncbi:MAG: sensor histidine kinase [Haliscomenobacteraceae bacterium CHB4]|nr:hypothetical protein [Saprospiraceae bacterium]MCE7926495.1 sensor histidine kinase [Haliscomenobacteraceae bacterium CHB4]
MQSRVNARSVFLPLLLLAKMTFWCGAQSDAPICAPLSSQQESIDCWLKKADRLLKNKQLDEAALLLQKLEGYTADQPLLEAHRLNQWGNFYWRKNDFDSSYVYKSRAARIYLEIKHLSGASATYEELGALMIRKVELDKAAHFLYKAIELADQAGLDSLKAVPFMNLSNVFGQLGDGEKERAFLLQSHILAKKYKNQRLITITGADLATCYIEASMLDSARHFALHILREMQNNHALKACSYYSLALWETSQGNWEAANQYYLKIKNDSNISDYYRIGYLQGYANFLKARKLYAKAKPVYEDIMDRAKKSGQNDFLFVAYREYYPMLEEMKDYRRAYEVAKEYIVFHDSVHNIGVEEKVREINVKYETAEKERALQASKLELAEHTNQRNLLLGGMILIGLLGMIVVLRQRYRIQLAAKLHEQEVELAKQKIERLHQEQSYLALQSMVTGEDAERNRLAKELHDGLGGLLSSLKLTLTNRNNCLDDANCRETVHIVDKASMELRRIAQNLMPEALSKFGLIASLEDLCADVESHAKIQTSFQHYGIREPLPQSMVLPLYRIVQESLNNVVKHSQATEVVVQLIQQDYDLHLTIEDNGVGFQPEKALGNGGSGLKNLQSRVTFLDGSIEFDSAPGAGTSINIAIPITKGT